jgi:membrane associated rhomboid family serine protease
MRLPQSWAGARFTLGIAAVTAFAWLVVWVLQIEDVAAIWAGFIPDRVTGLEGDDGLAPVWLTPLTSALVHGGLMHLLFNMMFLLICGRAIEPIVGRVGLVALYVVGAYAAAAGQYLLNIERDIPMIGASGSVSALVGAYALLFGRHKVKVASPGLGILLHALWLAAAWTLFQIAIAFAFQSPGSRILVGACIGGFLAGLVLARPLFLLRYRRA